jgi:type VI secretion system protein ImpH
MASDVAALVKSERPGPPLTLSSPVLSLAGAHGPLPMPYTEVVLERRRMRDASGLDFLDIFNQRILGFLYRSRRKHHLALAGACIGEAPLVRCLDALASLGRAENVRGPHGEQAWLRHAAVQGAAPRSMTSLLAVVRDRLGVQFTGKQFVGGWHTLANIDRARLHSAGRQPGMQAMLGYGVSLGARAWDQGGGIALDAPALQPARFAALLPGGQDYSLLGWLVGRHLQRDMQVQLKLELATRPATRLMQAAPLAPRLGLSAWLCSAPAGEAATGGAIAGAIAGATADATADATAGKPVRYQQPRFILTTDSPRRN